MAVQRRRRTVPIQPRCVFIERRACEFLVPVVVRELILDVGTVRIRARAFWEEGSISVADDARDAADIGDERGDGVCGGFADDVRGAFIPGG
jgi:hypothetical protein